MCTGKGINGQRSWTCFAAAQKKYTHTYNALGQYSKGNFRHLPLNELLLFRSSETLLDAHSVSPGN